MKIIISPSKTADYQKSTVLEEQLPLYPSKTKKIVATIRKLHKSALSKALHIKGTILDETYQAYRNYYKNDSFQAFASYNGLVYKQLDKSMYGQPEYHYISSHLRILDALYGILEPGTLIKPYRLDMKANIGINLYQFWNVNPILKDELIVNLASKEFSSMINHNMITIDFLEKQGDTYKSLATYSKIGRGKMLHYMILNQIKDVEQIKQFNLDNYIYSEEHSNPTNIVFVRG